MVNFNLDTNGTIFLTMKLRQGSIKETFFRVVDISSGDVLYNINNIEDKVLIGEMKFGQGVFNENCYYYQNNV